MTPEDRLRETARLMRERAQAARAGAWITAPSTFDRDTTLVIAQWSDVRRVAACSGSLPEGNVANAEHIASWHPAVALAVADWLEVAANQASGEDGWTHPEALAVADAYLGTAAPEEVQP